MGLRARLVRLMDVGGLPATFWWLWVGTLVNRTGAFVLPFMSYYLTQSLGRSAAFAGFVAALNAAGAAVSAVVGGVLADRIGRRPTLLGANLGSAAMLVALGLSHTAALIVVFSFLSGLAGNASRPATSAMIADLVRPEDRTRAYALNFWGVNLGFAVAMLAGGLLASYSYLSLFLGDAATTLICAVLVFRKVPETGRPIHRAPAGGDSARHEPTHGDPAQPEPARHDPQSPADGPAGSLVDVLRDRLFLAFLAVMLIGAVVYQQANATQPVSAGRDGLSPGTYGITTAVNGILIVAAQLPLTAWLRRFRRGPVLAVSTLLQGGGFAVPLLIVAAGHPAGWYLASCVVWTIGEIGSTPTLVTMVADLSPAHLRGRYQGMYNLAWSLAGVVGPLLGGWALSASGSAAVWWGSLALGALGVPAWLALDRPVAARATTGQPAVVPEPVPVAAPVG